MTKTDGITVRVIEQPGGIGRGTASELGHKLAKLLERPLFRAEVEERMRRKKEEAHAEQ